jgi:hypothetical protein
LIERSFLECNNVVPPISAATSPEGVDAAAVAFITTHWSVVLAAQGDLTHPLYGEALTSSAVADARKRNRACDFKA